MDKKQVHKEILNGNIEKMASLLDEGKTLEIQRSRSGLKMYSSRKTHEDCGNRFFTKDGGAE